MKANDTQIVLRALASVQCHSIKNPIPREALADSLGISTRDVSTIIGMLQMQGYKIGYSRGRQDEYLGIHIPSGYFLAVRPEEIMSTVDELRDMIANYAAKVSKLLDWGTEPTLFEQRGEVV